MISLFARVSTRVLLYPRWLPLTQLLRCVQTQEATSVVSRTEIQYLLDSKKYSYKLGHSSFVLQCPFCSREGAASPAASMFVNYNTGSVVCKPCALKGTWSDFLGWSHQGKSQPSQAPSPVLKEDDLTDGRHVDANEHAQKVWSETRKWGDSSSELVHTVREVFRIEKLDSSSLMKYDVRTAINKSKPCVAFPWHLGEQFVRVKLCPLPPTEETTFEPSKGPQGLFGWKTVKSHHKEIVLTAGEFDAVAAHQVTGLPTVAIPSNISTEMVSQFDQFEKIYLWLGSSSEHRRTATQAAKKLGLSRCLLVGSETTGGPMTAALKALNSGVSLKEVVAQAKPFEHEQIFSFKKIRRDVYAELSNRDMVCGVKWQRFPRLTSILKGHRRGELTVFTGPTGRGKTTLLGELSLDLCTQGVSTLWGSFEIKNTRLAKTLLKQYSGLNIENHLDQYDHWADKFQQLSLYFMGFYGSADINSVIETMSHAVHAHDIQHVIVDNLQFMLGSINVLDRYSAQNQAVAALRKFATIKDVHVTVVIHPRKEDDSNQLTTASIFGTAKATQEADNVVILQCPQGKDKCLQVTKNRFDGDLGKVPLYWDKESCTMSGHFGHTPLKSPSSNTSQSFDWTQSSNAIGQTSRSNMIGRPPSSDVIGRTSSSTSTIGRPQSSNAIGQTSSSTVIGHPPSSNVIGRTPSSNAIGRPQSSNVVGRSSGKPVSGSPLSKQASKDQANGRNSQVPTGLSTSNRL